jgi:hypothetical protein
MAGRISAAWRTSREIRVACALLAVIAATGCTASSRVLAQSGQAAQPVAAPARTQQTIAPSTVQVQSVQAAPLAPANAPLASGDTQWTRVPAAGADELWYDREMLVYSGGEVTFWRRVNFATPQSFKGFQVRSALYREMINCEEHTMRVHAQLFRSIDGATVEHVNFSAPESVAIVPDTVGDALARVLCPAVTQRRLVDERIRGAQERLDNRRRDLERLRGEVEELEASLGRLRTEVREPLREPVRELPREPMRELKRETVREPVSDGARDATREAPRQTGRQGL